MFVLGTIYTPTTEGHIVFEKAYKDEIVLSGVSGSFFKRVGKPRKVVYVALFLTSGDLSFVTRAHLVVD